MSVRSYGDYSGGDHLFPFRTEKLSPPAQMVLQSLWESMSLPIFYKPGHNWPGFLFKFAAGLITSNAKKSK